MLLWISYGSLTGGFPFERVPRTIACRGSCTSLQMHEHLVCGRGQMPASAPHLILRSADLQVGPFPKYVTNPRCVACARSRFTDSHAESAKPFLPARLSTPCGPCARRSEWADNTIVFRPASPSNPALGSRLCCYSISRSAGAVYLQLRRSQQKLAAGPSFQSHARTSCTIESRVVAHAISPWGNRSSTFDTSYFRAEPGSSFVLIWALLQVSVWCGRRWRWFYGEVHTYTYPAPPPPERVASELLGGKPAPLQDAKKDGIWSWGLVCKCRRRTSTFFQ